VTVLEQTAHLAGVPIDIGVELGRCHMTLREIMGLAEGSVIKLPRSAGENIDILAGGHPVGSAEVVIIEDRFGVRITDFREME
jgi:flagellar motor switch protein FliN/FliY